MKVLIVSDDSQVVMRLNRALQDMGYHTVISRTSEEAEAELSDASQRIRAIVCAADLKGRGDGAEWADMVHETASLPVLVIGMPPANRPGWAMPHLQPGYTDEGLRLAMDMIVGLPNGKTP